MSAKKKYDVVLPPYLAWPVSLNAADQVQDWGHKYLRAAEFYGKTRGESAIVAILDTAGEFVHPDLIDNALNRYGKNFTDAPSLIDVQGHGTHCAGIAAATDNQVGVIGVAPGTHLLPVKVLNDGGFGQYRWIAAGIRYVANLQLEGELNDYPRIISMSLGGPSSSKILKEAVDYAIGKGCFIVAAAGNSGYQENKNTVGYPGRYREVITIASIGKGELPSRFSSAGEEVDLAAPGQQVYSTHKNGGYAYLSGTSMATPHVAGLCALILSHYAEIKAQAQLEAFLKKHAKDLHQEGEDVRTGHGAPIAPEYLDQDPGEAPEQPDTPTEPEEPTREERTLLIPFPKEYGVYWRTRTGRNMEPLKINGLVVRLTTDKTGPAAVDALSERVERYFTRRGYILPDHMDYQDAVYYVGIFLQLIVGRELDVQVHQILGADPLGRAVWIEKEAYTRQLKKHELREANTFSIHSVLLEQIIHDQKTIIDMQNQEERYGIQETEELFDLAVSIKEAIALSKEDDGKVDLRKDFANFIRPVTILPRAFEGARKIPKEWGDLSESEIIRLRDRYGELVDDERWQRAFIGLVIAGDAIYEIASEERAA